LNREQSHVFRILSVDGGGYLGLATAAFIKGIEHHCGVRFSANFDLFCGTSTGAIIALGLAIGRSGGELTDLYRRLGKSIFTNPRLTRGCMLKARYSNRPLRRALEDEFGQATLGDLCAAKKYALITAFNLTDGKPRIFKTDHASHLTLHNAFRLSDIALASSAAPFYFPAVPVKNPLNGVTELYCDGGVVANHPALLGFSEAVSDMKIPPGQIRILSLSTPGEDLAEGTTTLRNGDRGLVKWGAKLPSMFIESGSAIADQILRRLIGALPEPARPWYERVEMRNRERLTMDCATAAATRALDHEGTTQASYNHVRDQVRRIIL
jgi:patatin-like phospholipase/acyl hydrolase